MLLADDQNHARYRSFLAPTFSTKAIGGQSDLVKGYVDLLVQGLAAIARDSPQNMVAWLNWTLFDVRTHSTVHSVYRC